MSFWGGRRGSWRKQQGRGLTCKCPHDPGRYIKEERGRMFARDWEVSWDTGFSVLKLGKSWANQDELVTLEWGQAVATWKALTHPHTPTPSHFRRQRHVGMHNAEWLSLNLPNTQEKLKIHNLYYNSFCFKMLTTSQLFLKHLSSQTSHFCELHKACGLCVRGSQGQVTLARPPHPPLFLPWGHFNAQTIFITQSDFSDQSFGF